VLIPPNIVTPFPQHPLDDTNTMFYFIAWVRVMMGHRAGSVARVLRRYRFDRNFRLIRTRENDYLQDREAMKHGSHTGITGIPNQDIAMWETMGPIADRSQERPGASDLAIARFRRIMIEAARTVRDGGAAIGTLPGRIPHVKLRSFEGIVPKTTPWTTLGVAEDEIALRRATPAETHVTGD
jgi:phthalate 4,5-dioxygenase oxygenase subunit